MDLTDKSSITILNIEPSNRNARVAEISLPDKSNPISFSMSHSGLYVLSNARNIFYVTPQHQIKSVLSFTTTQEAMDSQIIMGLSVSPDDASLAMRHGDCMLEHNLQTHETIRRPQSSQQGTTLIGSGQLCLI